MVRTYVYIFIFMTIDCTESGKKHFVCENKILTVKLLYFTDKSLSCNSTLPARNSFGLLSRVIVNEKPPKS